MTTQEIAKTIMLKRQNVLTPIVRQTDMRDSLGADGYQEAMRLGWLIPNYDTGEMQIPNDFKCLGELRAMAEALPVTNTSNDPEVGDMVTVNGQVCTVDTVVTGGRYILKFDPTKPKPTSDRVYAKNELKMIKKGVSAPINPIPGAQQTQTSAKNVVSTPYVSANQVGTPYVGTPLVK